MILKLDVQPVIIKHYNFSSIGKQMEKDGYSRNRCKYA